MQNQRKEPDTKEEIGPFVGSLSPKRKYPKKMKKVVPEDPSAPKKRKVRRKPGPKSKKQIYYMTKTNRNLILVRVLCPLCDTPGAFLVRKARSKHNDLYGRCIQCAAMVFCHEAIVTYLRKMRYQLIFEAMNWKDLDELFAKTEDLRYVRHIQYKKASKNGRVTDRKNHSPFLASLLTSTSIPIESRIFY